MELSFNKVNQGSSIDFGKDLGLDFEKDIGGDIVINLNWGTDSYTSTVDIDLALSVIRERTFEVGGSKGFFGFGKKEATIETRKDCDRSKGEFVYCFNRDGQEGFGIYHHGDDTTGAWSDGEFITIDTSKLSDDIIELAPSILSWSGHNLSDLPFANMKVYIGTKEKIIKPLFQVDLTNLDRGTKNAQFGKLVRNGTDWTWTTDIKKGRKTRDDGFTELHAVSTK